MLGRKGAFDDVCGTVGYKLFDLRIRFDADDYAACDIVCHCIQYDGIVRRFERLYDDDDTFASFVRRSAAH